MEQTKTTTPSELVKELQKWQQESKKRSIILLARDEDNTIACLQGLGALFVMPLLQSATQSEEFGNIIKDVAEALENPLKALLLIAKCKEALEEYAKDDAKEKKEAKEEESSFLNYLKSMLDKK